MRYINYIINIERESKRLEKALDKLGIEYDKEVLYV